MYKTPVGSATLESVKISPWPLIATLFRIALVPVIVVLILTKPAYWSAICCALFIVASLTDWLDGYLARRLESVTLMGQFLDPIADKVLVSSVLLMFISEGLIEALAVLILINRDVIISGIRSVAAAQGQIIAAGSIGKWKTTVQMIAIPSLFLSLDWNFLPFEAVGYYGLWLSVVLSLVSGYTYLKNFLRQSSTYQQPEN